MLGYLLVIYANLNVYLLYWVFKLNNKYNYYM